MPAPSHTSRRRAAGLALAAATAVLPACATGNPQSTLSPAGSHAAIIFDLYIPIFWAAVLVFVVVEAVLLYSVWRYRQRPGQEGEIPAQVHGNTRLEIAWTVAPAVVVAIIAIMTFRTQAILASFPTDALNVRVIGHQWWWEFQYPDLGITTANELHVPAGRPVKLTLESADVIHSFWIPRLAGKTDTIPGLTNQLWFRADRPGTYRGQCAEFCGTQHALMGLRVIVTSQSEFDAWVRAQRQPATIPTSGAAARGAQLFLDRAATAPKCWSCHTIAGTDAQGKVGPDLTHVGSRSTIVAGLLENTPENLAKWIHDPQGLKKGALMPNLGLSEQQAADLAAFLSSLK